MKLWGKVWRRREQNCKSVCSSNRVPRCLRPPQVSWGRALRLCSHRLWISPTRLRPRQAKTPSGIALETIIFYAQLCDKTLGNCFETPASFFTSYPNDHQDLSIFHMLYHVTLFGVYWTPASFFILYLNDHQHSSIFIPFSLFLEYIMASRDEFIWSTLDSSQHLHLISL